MGRTSRVAGERLLSRCIKLAATSFPLGYPSGGYVGLELSPEYSQNYYALYFQDSRQVNRRLSVNYGLRWDCDSPTVEAEDRQNRGFDFYSQSPIRVAGLDLKGGLLFAAVDGHPRTSADPDRNNLQPRLGIAYKVSERLVFRGGIGKYYLPVNIQTASYRLPKTKSRFVMVWPRSSIVRGQRCGHHGSCMTRLPT